MDTKWFDVAGKVYRVTEESGHVFLHGVRGACYALVPFQQDPTRYWVTNRKGQTPRDFSRLVLRIVDGSLEVA